MDEYSKKYLLAGVFCIFILQSVLFGAEYFSFGKSINENFGPDYTKRQLVIDIFVPVSGTVIDVNIALNMEHSSFCDFQIFVGSPQLEDDTILINYYDDFTNRFDKYRQISGWVILDEESIFDIDQSWEPYMGLFRPNGDDRLSQLYGQQSGGWWRIEIYDARFNDTGLIKDIRLDMLIDTGAEPLKLSPIPEPATVLLLAIGGIFAFKSRYGS